jgi:hypothetical protein
MSEWSQDKPRSPGIYEFKCMETDYEVEIVPVERKPFLGLYAKIDELWRPVEMWHDGLTDCWWRSVESPKR